ncbi:hypothetical protein M405DRAFT_452552 [Rhizopogon salebrosus TDB-379]|nr:hypothetical protein M405DRAFT_452552 [Rhizopogon salebrosus TDB-379]
MLTWTWFLTAHILDYTTIDSCQVSVPLVWWLTFTILCTTYFLVLKVLVSMIYGILVFGFLGTVLHLPFSIGIILLRLRRHPFQNPRYMCETLPKAIVERIPLVIYIPPPPEDDGKAQPISLPKPVHRYPLKPPTLRMPRH